MRTPPCGQHGMVDRIIVDVQVGNLASYGAEWFREQRLLGGWGFGTEFKPRIFFAEPEAGSEFNAGDGRPSNVLAACEAITGYDDFQCGMEIILCGHLDQNQFRDS